MDEAGVGKRNSEAKSSRSKLKIWVYTGILFLSALTVLLLVGYSQIKFNSQIIDYKSQLLNNESEKRLFKSNLDIALDQNKYLKDELETALITLESQKKLLLLSSDENKLLKSETISHNNAYEAILSAANAYNKGNILICAYALQAIKNGFPELLNEGRVVLNMLDFLWQKCAPGAAKSLYEMGLELYGKHEYQAASCKFRDSLLFSSVEYFSDDSLYYLAYCDYNTGEREDAAGKFKYLIWMYPSSNCISDAAAIIKSIYGVR